MQQRNYHVVQYPLSFTPEPLIERRKPLTTVYDTLANEVDANV